MLNGPELYFDSLEEMRKIYGSEVDPGCEKWIAAGRPHLWVKTEVLDQATLLKDHGWGWMKLIVGDKEEITVSHHVIHLDGYVALDKEYYLAPKCIWR